MIWSAFVARVDTQHNNVNCVPFSLMLYKYLQVAWLTQSLERSKRRNIFQELEVLILAPSHVLSIPLNVILMFEGKSSPVIAQMNGKEHVFWVSICRGILQLTWDNGLLLAKIIVPYKWNYCHSAKMTYRKISNIRRAKSPNLMFLVSSCSCLCPIQWSQVLSREWRCSWSSTGAAPTTSEWSTIYCLLRRVLY